MLYHEQNSEAVIKELSSNSVSGLTAEQALQRQTQYGENKLKEKKKKTKYDLDWVIEHTAILHFCGKAKPWKKGYLYRFGLLYKHYEQLTRHQKIL